MGLRLEVRDYFWILFIIIFYNNTIPVCVVLGIGLVLRYPALGRGRTLRVGTTSSSQLRRHSGWSLALGRRYRSALELETGRTKKCIQMQNDSW